MVSREQDKDEGFCCLGHRGGGLCPEVSGKQDRSDVPRLCYLSCQKITDRLTFKVNGDLCLSRKLQA